MNAQLLCLFGESCMHFCYPTHVFCYSKVRYGFRLTLGLGPASGSGLYKFMAPGWRLIFVGPQWGFCFMWQFWEAMRYLLYCETSETQSILCPFLFRCILIVSPHMWSRDSVVSVVTGLLGGRSGLQSPAGAREFSVLQNIQTGCGAHLAPSQYVGLTVLILGDKAAGAWSWPLTFIQSRG